MLNSIVVAKGGTKDERCAIRWVGAFVALLLVACFWTPAALGQCTLSGPVSTWNDGNSNWNNGSNWSPMGVPNSPSTSVCITDGTSKVTLDTTPTLANLQLASGNTLTVSPGESLYVDGSQIINAGNIAINAGNQETELLVRSVSLQGGGTVTLSTSSAASYPNYALIETSLDGSTLTNVDNTIQGEGIIGDNGLNVLNESGGTIDANSTGGPLRSTLALTRDCNFGCVGTLTNNGTMEATAGGTLQVTINFTNFSGNTLTGGTYIVDGTSKASTMILSLGSNTGGEIVNNAANIILNGTNGNVSFIDANGNQLLNALAANSTVRSGLTIENGYNLSTPGDFSNAGSVTVGKNSTLTIGSGGANNYTQSGGASLKVNGSLTAAIAFINGGTVSGSGTVVGNVNNAGGIVTASDPGIPDILTIHGNYAQGASGTLEAFLGGLAAGTGYSQLDVTGTATLGGTLNVTLINSFDPTNAETFFILTSDPPVQDTFATLDLPGAGWSVSYNQNCPNGDTGCVDLSFTPSTTTPEPSAVILFGTALAMAAFLALRKAVSGS